MSSALKLPLIWLVISAPLLALGEDAKGLPRFADDPRLDTPMQVELLGRPISTLCEEIAKQSGIAIAARGVAADRKLTLILHKTVRQILDDVHEITGYAWTRDWSKAEAPDFAYVVWRDTKTQWLEEDLRNRQVAEARAERAAEASDMLARYSAALALDPDSGEFQALRETDPQAFLILSKPAARAGLEFLFSLDWPRIESLAYGSGFSIPFPELTADQQQKVLTLFGYDAEAWAEHGASWDISRSHEWVVTGGLTEGMELGLNSGDSRNGVLREKTLMRPADWVNREDAIRSIRTDMDGMAKEEADRLFHDVAQAKREEAAEKRRRELQGILDANPDLARVIDFSPDGVGSAEATDSARALATVARGSGLQVVAHYFTTRPRCVALAQGRLIDAVEDVAKWFCLEWEKRGETLYLRDTDWFHRIETEVPEGFILRWTQRFEAQGEFTLDDLAAMAAALTVQQAGALRLLPEFPSEASSSISRERAPALRFYSTLQDHERRTARNGSLELTTLTRDQTVLFVEAVKAAGGSVEDHLVENAALQVRERLDAYGQACAVLRFTYDAGKAAEVEIVLPRRPAAR